MLDFPQPKYIAPTSMGFRNPVSLTQLSQRTAFFAEVDSSPTAFTALAAPVRISVLGPTPSETLPARVVTGTNLSKKQIMQNIRAHKYGFHVRLVSLELRIAEKVGRSALVGDPVRLPYGVFARVCSSRFPHGTVASGFMLRSRLGTGFEG
jgi:hypothetical protein